jgi:hypothetical protein
MISFGLEDSSDWKFSVYGFPASRAKSWTGSNSGNVISWGFGFLLCWFELLMRHFTSILVVLNSSNCGFLLYSVYPLLFWDKKVEYFLFWTENVFPNRSSVFLSQNGQMESLLVFYVGYILDDKNTLCNSYKLTRWSAFISESSYIWTVFISKHVTDHKFLEDVHEDSL